MTTNPEDIKVEPFAPTAAATAFLDQLDAEARDHGSWPLVNLDPPQCQRLACVGLMNMKVHVFLKQEGAEGLTFLLGCGALSHDGSLKREKLPECVRDLPMEELKPAIEDTCLNALKEPGAGGPSIRFRSDDLPEYDTEDLRKYAALYAGMWPLGVALCVHHGFHAVAYNTLKLVARLMRELKKHATGSPSDFGLLGDVATFTDQFQTRTPRVATVVLDLTKLEWADDLVTSSKMMANADGKYHPGGGWTDPDAE